MERQREKERAAAAAEDPRKIAQREAIEKRREELQKKDRRPITKAPDQVSFTLRELMEKFTEQTGSAWISEAANNDDKSSRTWG